MRHPLQRLFSLMTIFVMLFSFLPAYTSLAAPAAQPAAKPAAESVNPLAPVVSAPVEPAKTEGLPPAPTVNPLAESKEDAPERPGTLVLPKAQATGESLGDGAVQTQLGPLAMPTPIVNFEGVNNVDGVLPPDTDGEVGPNHYVQMVNLSTAIYDKNGNLLFGPFHPSDLWPVGDTCRNSNDGDPVVLYDQLADRWLLTQFALPNFPSGPYYQCIAVSKTGNPTNNPADWYPYTFLVSSTKMNDYPKIGVWPDAYYMTANQFTGGSSWGGAGVWALDRAAMLNGAPATFVYFDLFGVDPNFGGMLPVDLDGSVLPPAGAPGYFFEVDDSTAIPPVDAMRIWEFHVDWTTPANSTFGLGGQPNVILPTEEFDWLPCGGARSCIPQPGTSVGLDSIGDRLMFRAAYRNYGGFESVVLNHTVVANPATGQTGVRWYELRNPGGAAAIHQQGTFAPNDGSFRWMASIAQDHVGNIAVGYSVSSSTIYPSIRYTGRLNTDPLGQMPQGEAEIIAGGGSQTHPASRWGDYSAMSVDPVDDCTFWYTQEYIQTTGNAPWQTRVASFKFPNCSLGPTGTLDGVVSESSTSLGIEGASIVATASLTQTGATTSGPGGSYSISLPVATYDVTASAYGYLPATVSGVGIISGTVTTQDFALDPAPAFTLYGQVTDGATGWPLYAKIDIVGYPNGPIWTDPATGQYSVELVGGTDYTMNVSAFSAGYMPSTVAVGVLTGDTEINVGLGVDRDMCVAPGYELQITGVYEPFSALSVPPGWTVINNGGSCEWSFNDPGGRGNLTGGAGNFAVADSDICGPGTSMNTDLISPLFDVSALGSVNLEFKYDYFNFQAGEIAATDLSADGGATWTNVVTWTSSQRGPATFSQDVTSIIGGSTQAQLRFHYFAPGWDWWWEVDDAFIGEKSCVPMAGGLVVGNVYDGNTIAPLGGAAVENEAGYLTEVVATPLDPAVDDAFYTLFSPAGDQLFTASKKDYAAESLMVTVPLSSTVRQDFTLGAGWITSDPAALSAEVPAGAAVTVPLTLTNSGVLPTDFTLLELDKGFVPYGPFEKPAYVVKPFRQEMPTAAGLGLLPPPRTAPLAAGDLIAAWPSGLASAWGVAFDGDDGTVWVSDGWGTQDIIKEFNPDGSETGRSWTYNWSTTNGPADGTFNWNTGMIWLMNINTGVSNCIYEIDPASGPTGNTICPGGGSGFSISQRGLAYDPSTDTYFAGSWNDSSIHRFAPDGTILSSVNVGLAVAGLAYNPDTGHLFVQENGGPNDIFVLDANNNYANLGQFHPGDLSGGAGLEIDCDGNLWAIDQDNERVLNVESGETASFCGGVDVPWLSESPISATLSSGADQLIDVTMDAAAVQPGVYFAQLKIDHNTPYEVPNIPVQMTVTVPPDWGKISGAVSTFGYCDANPAFIEGATVLVETSAGIDYTLTTDANGEYAQWMPEAYSPITVTVDVHGYEFGQAAGVTIVGSSVTTQDFVLRWLEPCVSVVPDSLTVNLGLGQSTSRPVRLNNDGGATAVFTMTEANLGGPALPFRAGDPVVTSGASRQVTIGDVRLGTNPAAVRGQASLPAAPERPAAQVTLTHSLSQVIQSGNSAACGYGSGQSADNAYLRVFDLAAFGIGGGFDITNVEFGVEQASGGTGSQPVTVNLYTLDGDFVYANLTLIGTADISLPNQSLTIVNVPVTGSAPAGSKLVVEVFQPDGLAGNNTMYIGSNNLGQTGPTYLASVACAFPEPTDVTVIGFPGMHLVMNVTGNTGGAGVDVPWLAENPITGTIASDSFLNGQILFDANQVALPGEYRARVNVNSNDPVVSSSPVDVTMNVSAPANWGVLAGTVSSLGYCDINPIGAPGAVISAESSTGVVRTVIAGTDGAYELWLNSLTSPYTVTVSAPEHTTGTATGVAISGLGAVTTVDFDLRLLVPCVSYTPDSFTVTVDWGGSATETLSLANTGAVSSLYTITEVAGGFTPFGPEPEASGGPDPFGYTFKDSNEPGGPAYSWIDVTGGTALGLTDDGEATITLPFNFPYYGTTSNTIRVGNNGAAIYNATAGDVSFSNSALTSLTTALIAPFWDDMDETAGNVYWTVVGSAPNRMAVIEWYNRPHYSNTGAATFEIVLMENGSILYQYQDVDFGSASYNNGASATVGIASGTAGTYLQYSYNTASLSDGLAICFAYPGNPGNCTASADPIPWLTEAPDTGSLAADTGAQDVTLTFDASVPEITQPGIYDGELSLLSQDAQLGAASIPVTLIVNPSATQGKFYGTVNSLGYCDANPFPAEGAAVTISDGVTTWDFETDAAGQFTYWLEAGAYTMSASAAEHISASSAFTITGGVTTTLGLDLRWLRPCVTTAPAGLSVTVDMGLTATLPMTAFNTGAASTPWSLSEESTGFTPVAPQPLAPVPFFEEAFEGSFPPAGWSVVDNIATGNVWDRNDALGGSNRTTGVGGSGFSAAADSDAVCNGLGWDTTLYSPVIDLAGFSQTSLAYKSNFQDFAGTGEIWLEVSNDGGATWTELRYQTLDDPSTGTSEVEDLSMYDEQMVQLRWRYSDNDDGCSWFWHIDDVVISGLEDVTWLSETPTSGVLDADTGSGVIDVTFDAGVPAIDQPGDYHANLNLESDDPMYPVIAFPVTMTVNAPATWGKVEGTVSSLGYCDQNPFPAAGAEVFIQSAGGMTWTLTADASGHYQLWTDEAMSPFSITASAPEHTVGQATNVSISAGQTTTRNFDLRWLRPCSSVNPDGISVELLLGETTTRPLTVVNSGAAETPFSFERLFRGFDPSRPAYAAPVKSAEASRTTGGSPANAADVAGTQPEAVTAEPSAIGLASQPYVPTAVLYDNGPLVNSPGTGAGGADESKLQNISLGMTTLGLGHQLANGNRVADDFTIPGPAGWQISKITFYAYQTGSPTVSTIDHVNFRIWDGPPDDPNSTVIFGDTTTNRLENTAFSNIYRVAEDTGGNNQRPIMASTATAGVNLAPGTYWLDWQSGGTLASGPWAPPITINGQTTTGNGLQWTGAWAAALDGGTDTPQGFPFIIEGEILGNTTWFRPEPVTGTLDADSFASIDVIFDTTVITQTGTYYGTLNYVTGDPMYPKIGVPVTMTVNAFGVDLSPATDALSADPGQMVTYTLQLTNYGSTTDTIDVTASGNTWSVSLPQASFTLAKGASADVIVHVTVPAAAMAGDSDTVTLTATSQADGSKTDVSTLTTTANAVYAMDMTMDTNSVAGFKGSTHQMTLTIMNMGNIADTYTITLGTHSWVWTASHTTVGPVAPGGSAQVVFSVTLPASAAVGDTDVVQVTVTSQGDPDVSMTVNLTAEIIGAKVYLPLMR